MGSKIRWDDPANEGQVDYVKVDARVASLIMLLLLAAVLKIAIANHWLDLISQIMNS